MSDDQRPEASPATGPETGPEMGVDDYIASMPQGMGALNEKMGIELTEISAERVVGTMPVEGNTQPYGLLHGGASVVLAETLGSVGSAVHAHPDRLSVGIEINATHHRSATAGTVTGTATAIHLGRTMATYEVVITDERGKRVCTTRITCALMPRERYAG
ncbi:hotdog fold thioesterase [Nocardioides sp.]|uniref:hotdog fold thioesterase n=1 Tax=Nocardioides sp. TaxID=35761 RepID=UPI0026348BDD|nr:hotdog fold thioesterase [Nocardioides sp.]MDI6908825.1 hotdog fold thioesterase [Nocardioides sp.]